MQNRPMAYKIFQCDFLLQQLLHTLPLVIFSFLSREVLQGKSVNRSSRKGPSLDFFVFSCFRYPRYQRITGHMPNCLKIFCLQLRLYGPVTYLCSRDNFKGPLASCFFKKRTQQIAIEHSSALHDTVRLRCRCTFLLLHLSSSVFVYISKCRVDFFCQVVKNQNKI